MPFRPIDSPDDNASIMCKPDGNAGRHSWGAKRKADGGQEGKLGCQTSVAVFTWSPIKEEVRGILPLDVN